MKKKKKSFKRILKHKVFRKRNLLSLIGLLVAIVFIVFIIIMNVLPIKQLLLIILILSIINLVGTIFINVHNKTLLKIFGAIILIISVICNCIGLYYAKSTSTFIKEAFTAKNVYAKNTYYVLSLKSNMLDDQDIDGEISVYTETINLSEAIDRLDDKFSIKEKQYDNIEILFSNLNNNIDRFALIDRSSYEIVFDIDKSLNKNDYDILYEFDVFTKKRTENDVRSDKFNIYVGGKDFAGLMDFNMIVTVNTKTKEILLTSIPKDYYVEVYDKNGRYDKLNFMNAYGFNTNRKTIEKLFDIKIDYSLMIDTNSLVSIVDYLDGIEFCSDYSFTTTHALVSDSYNDNGKKLDVIKGCQKLDGIETLTVAREREAFSEKDKIRQENCQKIIIAIFKKMNSMNTVLNYNETLKILGSLYDTDIEKKVVTNFIKQVLSDSDGWNIKTQSVDGDDGYDKVFLSDLNDKVIYPNYDTINAASSKIKETLK